MPHLLEDIFCPRAFLSSSQPHNILAVTALSSDKLRAGHATGACDEMSARPIGERLEYPSAVGSVFPEVELDRRVLNGICVYSDELSPRARSS